MTKEEHQLEEMVTALHQVMNISQTKATIEAKQEVVAIIDKGLDNKDSWHVILTKIVDWANK
jgi:cell fate (sporulation/competence/biofilm development) regulator YlbF (YheA/YmcA/DUF963 family)